MYFPVKKEYLEQKVKEFKVIEKLNDSYIEKYILRILDDRENQILYYLKETTQMVEDRMVKLSEEKKNEKVPVL
jgi:hypothetical protein